MRFGIAKVEVVWYQKCRWRFAPVRTPNPFQSAASVKLESGRRHDEHLMHPEALGSTSSRATVRLGSMRDQFAQQGRGVCYATLKAAILTPLDEFAQQGNGMRGGAETQKRPKACWDAHQYL